MALETTVIIPDTHTPYEDKRKFNLVLKVMDEIKFSRAIVLGDFHDFYPVSDHNKDPRRKSTLQEDIAYGTGRLAEIRRRVKTMHFIEGNHEFRMRRYLWRVAPELNDFKAFDLPTLLSLDKLKIGYTPYKHFLTIGKMNFTHDTGDAGAYAHFKSQQAFEGNVCIGHTHRLGLAIVGNAKGKPHIGVMLGWLGDTDKIDYEHRIKVLRNSVHGFGIGYHDTDTGYWTIVPVPIINNSAVVNGVLIKG